MDSIQNKTDSRAIFYGWWVVGASFFTLGLAAAFGLLTVSFPLLFFLEPPVVPYLFALVFGLATGADFLLVALLAADHFGVSSLARVIAILLPVMTVGQTWFPYLVAVLREQSGNYVLPLGVMLLLASMGWIALSLLPELAGKKAFSLRSVES